MSDRYECHSHCVFNLSYHIIFCPKYRRKVLQWGIDERLKILLVEKATLMDCHIEKTKNNAFLADIQHFSSQNTYFCKHFCIFVPYFILATQEILV